MFQSSKARSESGIALRPIIVNFCSPFIFMQNDSRVRTRAQGLREVLSEFQDKSQIANSLKARVQIDVMLFECAICAAVASLLLVGAVGLLVVLRIEPF
jgi:hypothetical protein